MMDLVAPRLISLDSGQLGTWARDRASQNTKRRSIAMQFERALIERGIVILLCFHHFSELICTENDADAAACIDLIAALPIVSWITNADGSPGFGTILAIKTREVRNALASSGGSADAIRKLTKPQLMTYGSGIEAIAPYIMIWRELRPHLRAQAQEAQRIVAVTQAYAIGTAGKKIAELRRGHVRRPDEIAAQLARLQLNLQREVTIRGDKRIVAPSDIARDFANRVGETLSPLLSEPQRFHEKMLALMQIDHDEVPPNATVADLTELYLFRQQMIISGEAAGERWDHETVRQLKIDQIPSSFIEAALHRYRQDQPERKGSDMNDGHLACLAPYAEIVFADKRTIENVRRALPKVLGLSELMKSLRKSCPYHQILGRVDGLRQIDSGDSGGSRSVIHSMSVWFSGADDANEDDRGRLGLHD